MLRSKIVILLAFLLATGPGTTTSLATPLASGVPINRFKQTDPYQLVAKRTPPERSASFIRLAQGAWHAGNGVQAVAFFTAAERIFPDSSLLHFALTHFYFANGLFMDATKHLKKALLTYPNWLHLEVNITHAFPSAQEFIIQRERLERRIEKQTNPEALHADQFLLSYIYYFSNHKQKALALVQRDFWNRGDDFYPFIEEYRSVLTAPKMPPYEKAEFKRKVTDVALTTNKPLPPFDSSTESKTAMIPESGPDDLGEPNLGMFDSNTQKRMLAWYPQIKKIASQYKVDPKLILAIIQVESRFNPTAVSPMGARGMMQLIPATARRFGVKNIYDPIENIHGGVRYIRFLLDYFGDVKLALAGYNAGEANVRKYGGIPPFAETTRYVPNVLAVYRKL